MQYGYAATCNGCEISGPLSKIRNKNLRMRKIFNSNSQPKVHACEDSRRDFWTTDLKFPVHTQKEIPLTSVQHALFIRQNTESKVVTHDNRRAGKQKIQLTIFFLLNFLSSPLLTICKIITYCTKCIQGPLPKMCGRRGLVVSLYQSCSSCGHKTQAENHDG